MNLELNDDYDEQANKYFRHLMLLLNVLLSPHLLRVSK